MINYRQPGEVMEYANSGSAISSGDVVVLPNRVGVALTDIAATTGTGSVSLCGVYAMDKDGDEAFAQGDALYYDSGDQTMTKTAAGNTPAGFAWAAAESSAVTCLIQLANHSQRSANVAALAQTTSGSYTQAEVQAIATKVDAVIAALKNAGLMKNS